MSGRPVARPDRPTSPLTPGPDALELPGVEVEVRDPERFVLMRLTGFLSAAVLDNALDLLREAVEDLAVRRVVVDARACFWPLDADHPGRRLCDVLSEIGPLDIHLLCRDVDAPMIRLLGLLIPAERGRFNAYTEEAAVLRQMPAAFASGAWRPRSLRAILRSRLAHGAGPAARLMTRLKRRNPAP